MKPEAQRIAMAEACGWEDVFLCEDGSVCGLPPGFTEDQCPEGADEEVPDYLGDLNAIYQAEIQCLTTPGLLNEYDSMLCKVTGYARPICADAHERAEALLKTLGKWVEE